MSSSRRARFAARLGTFLATRSDALEVALGLALIVAGVAWWSPPAALIVAGLGILGSSLAPARRRKG